MAYRPAIRTKHNASIGSVHISAIKSLGYVMLSLYNKNIGYYVFLSRVFFFKTLYY